MIYEPGLIGLYDVYNKQEQLMKSETAPRMRILAFKNISQIQQQQQKTVRIDQLSKFINVVIIDMGGSKQERLKLQQIEEWLRSQQNIQMIELRKITKKQAFVQTYHQMIGSPLKTYFITNLPIEEFNNQPLQMLYRQMDGKGKTLEDINGQAFHNLAKIRFVILKDSLEGVSHKNYLHGGIFLMTTETSVVLTAIQDHLRMFADLKSQTSTSQINSQYAKDFGKRLDVMNEGLKIVSQKQKVEKDEIIAKLNSTPGVGAYNI